MAKTTGGDSGVLEGHRKAWADRANWPPEIQRFVLDFDATGVGDFISKACATSMKKYYTDDAWARKAAMEGRPEIKQAWQELLS